jgi:LemA protein
MSWETSEAYGVPRPIAERPRTGLALGLGATLVLLPMLVGFGLHNLLVSRTEAVDAAWAQVESAHQRRADLVPALVEIVKRHLRHEAETLIAVVETRSLAVRGVARERAPARADELSSLGRTQRELGDGMARLVALAESHPELRSADSFLALQAQLEGAENRIHVARLEFNDAVRAYNASIAKLPAAWIAEARGLERRAYFESEDGAGRAQPLGLD